MGFLPPQLRSAVLVVLMLVSYLGVAAMVREDTEAAPGSPGTPQPGTTVGFEDFEAGQGSQFTRLPSYTGRGGARFYLDIPYGRVASCLGFLGSMQWPAVDPNQSLSGCRNEVDGGWGTHRTMARHLGTFAGFNGNTNHAVTFVGNGQNGTIGTKEIATVTGDPGAPLVPFSNPTNRYLALGFDILGRTTGATGPGAVCAPREIKVSGELLFRDTQGQNPYHTGPVGSANPCDSPDRTFPGAPAGSYVAKHFMTKAVAVSSTYVRWGFRLRIEVNFHAGTAGSNNSTLLAFDNVRLVDATPQLDQSFSPTTVDFGGTSTLTYTITNTSELSAKQGLSFVNTLPSGLRVADPGNATNNCGGTAPTVSSGTTITAQGELAQGQASCTISIDVTSSTATTFTNQPSDFTTLSHLRAPASASVTFTNPPNVSITKTGRDPVTGNQVSTYTAGSTIDFRFEVRNQGPGNATGLRVIDTLPAGFTATGWSAGAGWSCTLGGRDVSCGKATMGVATDTITIHASVASSTTGQQSNTARLDADYNANADPTSSVTLHPAPEADLSISKRHTGTPTAGQVLEYDMSVTNGGPSDVVSFTVTDTLPDGTSFDHAENVSCIPSGQDLTCTRDDALTAGSTATFKVFITVAADFDPSQDLANTATVAPPAGTRDPNPANNSSRDTTGVDASADLSITKSHSGSAVAGTDTPYTIAVHNAGPSTGQPARDIVVTDTLPAGMSYVDVTGTNWDCSEAAGTVTCTLTEVLPPSTTAPPITLTVHLGDTLRGTITNIASVSATVSDPDPANNSASAPVSVTVEADLEITKSHTGIFIAGTEQEFTLTVTNHGPISDSPSFTVTDTLDPDLRFVRAEGDANCPVPSGQEVTCTGGVLRPGRTATFTIFVDVVATAVGGISNTATVAPPAGTIDPNPANDTHTDTVEIRSRADLGLAMAALGSLTAGQPVTYRLTITNHNGPSAARNVAIHHQLPPYLHYQGFHGSGWDCRAEGAEVACRRDAALSIDESVTVEVTVLVHQDAPSRAVHHARASHDGTDPTPAEASHSSEVRRQADLETILSHEARQHPAEQTVIFTYTVINHGPSAAEDVVLAHTLPEGISFPADAVTQRAALAAGAAPPGVVLVAAGSSAQSWPFSCATDGGQRLVCRTDTLLVGTYRLQVEARIWKDFTGSLTSVLQISSSTPDPNPDNDRSRHVVPHALPSPGGRSGPLPATGLSLLLLLAVAGSALLASGACLAYGTKGRRRRPPESGPLA